MQLRCQIIDGIWWIAKQLEDGKKITPVEPVVVAFQGEDIREQPNFWQILPCPNCGVDVDRGHDPLKHVYAEFGITPNEVIIPRKDVEDERMESDAPDHRQGWSERGGALHEGREQVLHSGQLVSLREANDRRGLEKDGLVPSVVVSRRGRSELVRVSILDVLLDWLEYLTKKVRRIRFRLLSERK